MNTNRPLLTLNRRIATAIERLWPYRGARAFDEFPSIVRRCVDVRAGGVLVDVGAGADSSFLDGVRRAREGLRVVGVDVASGALEANLALDETHVADVMTDGLPFEDDSVDIVTSRSLLEHLPDVDALIGESARVLRPGGFSVHICSCRNAPFALAGRALSRRFSQRLLFALYPEAEGTQGFDTHYDHCTPNEISSAFGRHGLEVKERRISYRSSQYFISLGPLFLLARTYEDLAGRLGLQRLASYVTVVAHKPDAPNPELPR